MAHAAERLYHLIAVNDRTKFRDPQTSYPMAHKECMTMASKFNLHKDVRLIVEEAKA